MVTSLRASWLWIGGARSLRFFGRWPGIQSVMPSRAGCLPVTMLARVGLHTGHAA